MRDPKEYDQHNLKKIFNWERDKAYARPPLSNKWNSNLGKLVCPRVQYSSDFMTWMIRRYNPINKPSWMREELLFSPSMSGKFRIISSCSEKVSPWISYFHKE